MVSLIISIYKNLPALDLILKSLQRQTNSDFEVIIAEDANEQATRNFIDEQCGVYSFDIRHVSQDDHGFRNTKINNEAIKIASGEKLVFIDGDCVLHPRFIETYHRNITEGGYYYGRRVMLGPELTRKLYSTRNLKHVSLMNLIFSDSTHIQEAFYIPFRRSKLNPSREIWGCNWGVLKEYLIGINGFDEDYTKPCFGEDLDVGWRLRKKYDLRLTSLKNRAIQYHLHHKMNWDGDIEAEGRVVFNQKKQTGHAECLNGIRRILPQTP